MDKSKANPKKKAVTKKPAKKRITYRTVEIQGERHKLAKITKGRDVIIAKYKNQKSEIKNL